MEPTPSQQNNHLISLTPEQQEEQVSTIVRLLKQDSAHFQELKNGEAEIRELLKNPVFDRALGCVYGAFIGDALGSYCEFEKEISNKRMKDVMQMPGNGTFNTAPGQVTDDSQLALHLGYGLNAYDPEKKLEEQHGNLLRAIASQYVDWCDKGRPFDIGSTTASAIRKLRFCLHEVKEEPQRFVEIAKKQVASSNSDSQSNGCLMRITPMAVFVATHSTESQRELEKLIRGKKESYSDEVQLTHSRDVVIDACTEWVWILRNLIVRKQQDSVKSIYEGAYKRCMENAKLKQWIQEATKKELMPGYSKMGWSKIAWSYGLHFLREITDKESQANLGPALYSEVIRKVIQQGGDTDTNACIVGGMIGALLGFGKLPFNYVCKSLLVDCEKSTQPRKSIYNPINAFYIVRKMFNKLPK